jgi:hypothetical protein
VALLATLPFAQGASAAARGYRLAGVMAAGESYLGFLELPDGGQVLVRIGSVVDGGTVVSFDAHSLRLRFPDRTLELTLDGSGKPPPAPQPTHVVVSGSEEGHVVRREVDVDELQAALQESAAAASRKAPSASRAAPDERRVVAQRLQPLLDLPADARVMAVNDMPIGSADAAVELVQQTLDAGMPARLNLQTPKGFRRVYLRPASDKTQGAAGP